METSKLLCTVVNFDGSAMKLSLLLFAFYNVFIENFIHAYNILIESAIHLACSCTVFIQYIFSFITWSKWFFADIILVACMNAFLNACMYIICVQCSMRANDSLRLGYTTDSGELTQDGCESYRGHLWKQHMLLTTECCLWPQITSKLDKIKKTETFLSCIPSLLIFSYINMSWLKEKNH